MKLFLRTLLCLILSCSALQAEKPNVLIISIDDLNDLPAFMTQEGDAKDKTHPKARTPHLDKLANQGTVFTRAHCQFPLCGPSRASLISGLLPTTLGYEKHMKDEDVVKRAKEHGTDLLHTYFAKHGYKTMAVGKIMHNHVPRRSVDKSGGRGRFSGGTGKLKKNWHQNGTSTDWAMAPERDEDLPDFEAAAWAVKQLETKHEEPFMLMVGFLRPHVPWYVPQKWFDLYPDIEKFPLPPYKADDLDDVPAASRSLNILKQMPRTSWAIENKQWRNILHAYMACTSFTDHYVGQVLSALENSPYRDNTIVLVFSDHGYHMGEKNTFQKQSLWERSSHVPFIIAAPGMKPGQRTKRVVSLLDIYPTLVELAGLPKNDVNEGHSLVPLLKDPNLSWKHPAIISWKNSSAAVQTERYRYIRYDDGSEELYDHDKDPHEWTNLANMPEMDPIKMRLRPHLPSSKNDK